MLIFSWNIIQLLEMFDKHSFTEEVLVEVLDKYNDMTIGKRRLFILDMLEYVEKRRVQGRPIPRRVRE